MTDNIVSTYRAEAQSLASAVTAVIDTHAVTDSVQALSADGVHYPPFVYRVSAEIIGQTIVAAKPKGASKKSQRRDPTGLGYPWRGMILFVALMTFIFGLGGKEF